jgi:hypothetical protein
MMTKVMGISYLLVQSFEKMSTMHGKRQCRTPCSTIPGSTLLRLLVIQFHAWHPLRSVEGSETQYGRDKTGEVRMIAWICVAALLLEPSATLGPTQFDEMCEALKLPADKMVAHFK